MPWEGPAVLLECLQASLRWLPVQVTRCEQVLEQSHVLLAKAENLHFQLLDHSGKSLKV